MNPELISTPIAPEKFQQHLATLGDMVKVVVDITRHVMTIGGELHADGEALLLEDGSQQENLWGANVYPAAAGDARVEYTSLINIRPRQGNRSQEIQSEEMRNKVRAILDTFIPAV